MDQTQKDTITRLAWSLVCSYNALTERGVSNIAASHDIAALAHNLLEMLESAHQREARGLILEVLDEALTESMPDEIHVQFPELN